jgi:glycosyltransferase involved in cell wall biosynthesis
MVVNNAVAHDARVMKSAITLSRAGADVVVLGVSGDGRAQHAELGSARFLRLPVLPPRAVSPGYLRWAATRRAGRLAPAASWRRALPVTGYYRRAFLPALAEVAPDVVHVHDVHLLAAVAEQAGRAARRPAIVYDAHEYVAGLAVSGARTQRVVDGWAALEREHVGAADRVITVAPGLAERLRDLHGLPRTPSVVYNAPLAWQGGGSASRDLRAECGVPAGATLAVYSGALSAARGVDTLVRALPSLPELHVAVVAVPFPHPMTGRLRELADTLGVGSRLHFAPPVPSHEVPAYLSGADLAVSPIIGDSVSYDMALPNKLFEFLHAGLPMAVSDCRAMADFVRTNGLGTVFRAGDPADLARSVRELLADPPRPDTSVLRATYSWQGQEPALVGAYDELVPGLVVPTQPWSADDLRMDWQPGKG